MDDSNNSGYDIPSSPASSDVVVRQRPQTTLDSKDASETGSDFQEDDTLREDDYETASNFSFETDSAVVEEIISSSSNNNISPYSTSRPDDSDSLNYSILDSGELMVRMQDAMNETREILGISLTSTRLLLHHFRWDKARLLERFFELDSDVLYKQFGIVPADMSVGAPSRACLICFCEPADGGDAGLVSAECGHQFCVSCGLVYVTQRVVEVGVITSILCPGHGCDVHLDDDLVAEIARSAEEDEAATRNSSSSSSIMARYNRAITNSFVECNTEYRWCPGAGCALTIHRLLKDPVPITCKCGKVFCFECGLDWHEPVNCFWLKKWLRRCRDDSETSNWIAANTKECPKCQACIEKAGGCNHILCRNVSCRHEFCWVCLGPWQPHGSTWYNCTVLPPVF